MFYINSIEIVSCISSNNGISYNNKIVPYPIEHIKFLREKIRNNIVIMGRNAYNDIGPLKDCITIVLTRKEIKNNKNIIIFKNIKNSLNYCASEYPSKKIIVIGGYSTIKRFLSLNLVKTIYLGKVLYHKTIKPSIYFPNIENTFEIENESIMTDAHDKHTHKKVIGKYIILKYKNKERITL